MREPPRKMHVRELEQGNPDCMNVEIYLDGEKQTCVISYDQNEGEIHRYVDPREVREDELTTETVLGKVEVRWVDESRVGRDSRYVNSSGETAGE